MGKAKLSAHPQRAELMKLARQAEQSTLMIVNMVDQKLAESEAIVGGLDAKNDQMSAADKERWYFARDHQAQLKHWRKQLILMTNVFRGYPSQYTEGHVMGVMEVRVELLARIDLATEAHDTQLKSLLSGGSNVSQN